MGCGILNETNTAVEILNNAIHANAENGVFLNVPGVFGLTYGSPKLIFNESNQESTKRPCFNSPTSTLNTFVLENNEVEPKVKSVKSRVTPYSIDNHSQWKMRHRTLGQILRNSITDNGADGIITNTTHFSAARFVIVGNGIYDNQGNGLSIQTECEIIGNDILGNNKVAVQAKSHAWIYLTMNRLHSLKSTAININQTSITLTCRNNVVYTTTLQSDVISFILDNGRTSQYNKDQFSAECFNAFRSSNLIEYFPDNITDASYVNELRFINSKSPINPTTGLHNYPLRPIIIKDTRYVRVSVALSDALNSFNRSPRSEICRIL